jgi:hypothetical protein
MPKSIFVNKKCLQIGNNVVSIQHTLKLVEREDKLKTL